jgi:hypothetical protein
VPGRTKGVQSTSCCASAAPVWTLLASRIQYSSSIRSSKCPHRPCASHSWPCGACTVLLHLQRNAWVHRHDWTQNEFKSSRTHKARAQQPWEAATCRADLHLSLSPASSCPFGPSSPVVLTGARPVSWHARTSHSSQRHVYATSPQTSV